MNNDHLLQTIRQLGFSEYEARCYLALFSKDTMAVSEVAKLSGVPRPNTYDALEKLMTNGFISAMPGKVKRYAVSDPNYVKEKSFVPMINSIELEIENLEKKRREKIAARDSLEKNIDSVISKLDHLYKSNRHNGNPLDYIEVLKNPHQIHRKFIELISRTEKEYLVFCKPPFACSSFKEQVEQRQAQINATARGILTRGIFEMPPEDQVGDFFKRQCDKPNYNDGDEFRVIDELPVKLNIFDNKTCLFTLEDPVKEKTSLTMLVTEHEAMAKTHRLLFESIWEKARNYCLVNGEKIYLPRHTNGNKGGLIKN